MTHSVVFDLDDTLYLERDYVRSGFRAVDRFVEATLGVQGVGEVAWRLFEEGHRRTTLSTAFELAGYSLTANQLDQVVACYRGHLPQIRVCPDSQELLASLGEDVRVAVITDGPAASQRAKVDALALARVADPIVVTAEHGTPWHKPSLLPFDLVRASHGTDPPECVYIADNPTKDFTAPRALGWRTIRVRRPKGLHADVDARPGEVDLVVESLSELIGLFG